MLQSARDGIAEAVDQINESYFYVPAHQTVFRIAVELWQQRGGNRFNHVYAGVTGQKSIGQRWRISMGDEPVVYPRP